ncbi:uncharacterized protein METZ01_LOCUS215317 [marine metagenome]|jgi:ribosomal protein L34E|uniref:Uncharacterized protein n=1 Tax=marine metagenome TaxID=408172 RepID=A0A382FJT5_9ZZZZ|tara:strand:+ start:1488 stop:1991 length:504 start_codon:yes stop_codon:yes gene_type:complete
MNINNYINDGFSKVCDVIIHPNNEDQWYYENVDESCVGPEHKSWLYFIVKDDNIIKCGETGNPLLLLSNPNKRIRGLELKSGSKSRLGRYMVGDQTDECIRQELCEDVKQGKITIWAKKCKVTSSKVVVMGEESIVERSIHKDLEMVYLNHFITEYGQLPLLNKSIK